MLILYKQNFHAPTFSQTWEKNKYLPPQEKLNSWPSMRNKGIKSSGINIFLSSLILELLRPTFKCWAQQ